MPIPMFGQGMKDNIRSAIAYSPDVIGSERDNPGKSVIASAQRRPANNAPARSIPVQDQGLPGKRAIVDRVTDRPDVVRASTRNAGQMIISIANTWARHGSPSCSVPVLGESLLISQGLIIDVTHRPRV